MTRKIAITDIHGMYNLFLSLLESLELNDNDELILLGDYIDRGSRSKDVISKIIELKKYYKVTTLIGNHDSWFRSFLNDELDDLDLNTWLRYGGIDTIESYCGEGLYMDYTETNARNYIQKNFKDHVNFLNKLELYYEVDNYYFVHAGIDPFLSDISKNKEHNFYWMSRNIFLPLEHCLDKIVVFGHTPVYAINEYLPYKYKKDSNNKYEPFISSCGKKIGIDGGAVFGNRLYAMIINDNKYEFKYVDNNN